MYNFSEKQLLEMKRLYEVKGLIPLEIADIFHCSGAIIYNIAHRDDWKIKPVGRSSCNFSEKQLLEMKALYEVKGLTFDGIGKRFGCDHAVINRIAHRNEWKIRPYGISYNFSEKQLLEMKTSYEVKGLPALKIAKIFGCGHAFIYNIAHRDEWEIRPSGRIPYNFSERQLLKMKALYEVEGLSCFKIGKIFRCNEGVIRRIAYRDNWKVRSTGSGLGKRCKYKDEYFPSEFERDCVIDVRKKEKILDFEFERPFHHHDGILVKKGNFVAVMEFHKYQTGGKNKGKDYPDCRTEKQYKKERRKELNETDNGKYKNLPIIFIKDLKEIEPKLKGLLGKD